MKMFTAYACGPKGSDSVIDCGTFATTEEAYTAIEARGLQCAEIETTYKETNYAAELSFFLLDKTGSVYGRWVGKLTANEQRALCGRVIGRGRIVIDGDEEMIYQLVKIAFGQDSEGRNYFKWAAL